MRRIRPRNEFPVTPVLVYSSGSLIRKSLQRRHVLPDPIIPVTVVTVFRCLRLPDFSAFCTMARASSSLTVCLENKIIIDGKLKEAAEYKKKYMHASISS